MRSLLSLMWRAGAAILRLLHVRFKKPDYWLVKWEKSLLFPYQKCIKHKMHKHTHSGIHILEDRAGAGAGGGGGGGEQGISTLY